jgi:hypothetical protein
VSDRGALHAELARLGLDATVEGRERLAVVVARSSVGVLTARDVREALVAAARRDGYSHLAVELTDASVADAPVPGGQPT